MFWRYRHYRRWRKQWSQLTLVATESEVIVGDLVALVDTLDLDRLSRPPKGARNWLRLPVVSENLAQLVADLQQINTWIQRQQDTIFSQWVQDHRQARHSVLLDFYLTDTTQCRLPVKSLLVDLIEALRQHQQLLRQEESFYYHRLSESCYQDCLVVLEVLIAAHGPLLEETP